MIALLRFLIRALIDPELMEQLPKHVELLESLSAITSRLGGPDHVKAAFEKLASSVTEEDYYESIKAIHTLGAGAVIRAPSGAPEPK